MLAPATMTSEQQQLCEQHIAYAHSIARHATASDEDFDEVRADALLGLVQAAARYQPDRGACFSTWAHMRIMGSIIDARRHRRSRTATRTTIRDSATLGQTETRNAMNDSEAAQHLGWSDDRLGRVREARRQKHAISLDRMVFQTASDTITIADTIASDDDMHTSIELRDLLDRLPDRERTVVQMHQDGYRLHEIGEMFGITESRVCQIRNTALSRLREAITA